MVRVRHLAIGFALALSIVASAQTAAAQAAKPPAKPAASRPNRLPADARDVNLRAYVELLRSDVRGQKVAILTEMMDFTEKEDATFWPIYREYDVELSKINDDRVTLIQEYAKNYEKMTDAVADRIASGALDLEGRRHALKLKYYDRLKSALSPKIGRAVPPGGKPAPHDHRPADFSGAAGRQVTRPGRRETTMNKQVSGVSIVGAILVILAIAGATLHADRVRLRSGQVVTGDFMSADVKMVRRASRERVDRTIPGRGHHRGGVHPSQGPAGSRARPVEGAGARDGTRKHHAQCPAHRGD